MPPPRTVVIGDKWSSGGALFDYEFDKLDPIYATQRPYTTTTFSPTTILPGASRNSLFITAHQDITQATSAFVDGLYTYRILRDAISYSAASTPLQEASVHEYAATGRINFALSRGWKAAVVGSFSEQPTLTSTNVAGSLSQLNLLYEGRANYIAGSANGQVLSLPTGLVRGAIWAGYRRQTYDREQGGVSSLIASRRAVRYAYGELAVPLMRASTDVWRNRLDLDISGRFEHYSDFGNEAVPKFGLAYTPFQPVRVRGSWGRAFRAPTLFDLHTAQELLYIALPDPVSQTGRSNALVPIGGNPELKPEKATTWTLGVDCNPAKVPGLRASATYFAVAYRDAIRAKTTARTRRPRSRDQRGGVRASESPFARGRILDTWSAIIDWCS